MGIATAKGCNDDDNDNDDDNCHPEGLLTVDSKL